MITRGDIFEVLSALMPLYVAMFLGYGSVRWWKIFTPDQCSGINRFVAMFAIPLLFFHSISTNNVYDMSFRFMAADSLQKLLILLLLLPFSFSKWHDPDWSITFYSISTLPNTILMGIPLLKAMYGQFAVGLMVQVIVLQSVVWTTILLFMLEYRKAKALLYENLQSNIISPIVVEVELDISSFKGAEELVLQDENKPVIYAINVSETLPMSHGSDLNDKVTLPKPRVATSRVIMMVWRKLSMNPTIYGSIIGLIWSLISFRWNVKLPKMIDGSISIMSNTSIGMAMFSIGLFMALQKKIITCGRKEALISMAIRFMVSPFIMAVASIAVGLRGNLLRVAIIEASLPQAVFTFVFAKEYDCHAGILCTAVIFGMAVAVPVTIMYYVLLGLNL